MITEEFNLKALPHMPDWAALISKNFSKNRPFLVITPPV